MIRSFAAILLALTLGTACSTGTDTVEPQPDTLADAAEPADVTTPDIPDVPADLPADLPEPDLPFDSAPDLAEPDTLGPACAPGEGCFLDPCTENSQCLSGYCLEHLGEGVCTITCQEECPPGWTCKPTGTGPDLTYVCVSGHANLCKPCVTTEGCKTTGGAEDVCVDYGPDGNFCGGKCTDDTDCPWGFSCAEVLTVNGIETTQCVADAGVCPCTGKSVELALWTPCTVTNDSGQCEGKRTCLEDGLTACDAPEPALEACNGVDDNCDGTIDEDTCDDGNPCTLDQCLGADGCEHTALDSGECIDGNPCTVADHCIAGACVGSPVACDDDNPCTDDSCDETGGCVFTPNTAKCDDGDPCTVADACETGACVGYAVDCECLTDADCAALEDGNVCNGTLTCDTSSLPHQCVVDPESVVTCPEPEGIDAICRQSACDPETGECSLVPDHEGAACEDGDPCTIGDLCQEGACVSGSPLNCNDGNPCTDDACDPDSGCVQTPNEAPCSDLNACTIGDGCTDGECVPGSQIADCDDDSPCTNDTCDPLLGCVHEPADGPCDDGNACTTGDTCVAGKCAPTDALDCDDDNVCTTDSCHPTKGCQHTLNQAPCDDGDVCTTSDHCHLGECIAGGTLTCDDSNPCTDDSCKPASGCSFVPNQAPCDDSNACTTQDTCTNGQCKGSAPPDCDDSNPCTTDACDPDAGCTHKPNTLPCEDSDLCTVNDVCADGECSPGDPLQCEDANPCTDDSCAPDQGCVFTANTNPCDDSNACTTDDLCADSVCGGTPVTCNDGDGCTTDSCDPDVGCVYVPISPCCGNDAVEPGEDCDDGNTTPGDGCDDQCQSENLSGCADGTADQIYQANVMVGCNGEYLGTQIQTACGPGWHPANPNEFYSYGGQNVQPSQTRWVDTAWDSQGNDVPLAQWQGYYDCSNGSGWQGVCQNDDCSWVAWHTNCTLTFVDHDYGAAWGCHCRGGNPNTSKHGVMCVNDNNSLPRL